MKQPFLQFGLPLILVVAVLGWYLWGRENVAPQQALQPVIPNEQINNLNGILPLIKWCITTFRPVMQSSFLASNSLNQQKVWDVSQLVGKVAAVTESLTFYALLQGEWTLGRSVHFGIVNDYKKLFDAGYVVVPWYSIVFSGVSYVERGDTLLQLMNASMCYEIERIDICQYRLRITTYDASKKRSIVSYGIIRIGDRELLISTADAYYPKDADPKKDGGDEVRVYYKR